ncbi:hypothetical protein EMIHUDRAFT_201590 [Emiliania huxleyi CCMP1516]|uniref:Uncharacterized protein n=2 Tax=Emiliania huxleyi TaxID=2903 RepID=A0A0D3KI88_EMIH1|nr:hypothetical protein EMIHUDRAFT_201590 [Emiliania huxleyi CCMP1516]EOD35473.1 hypothetical protein EMIHUDRAFT_201590 [Emiliania huxleyi CCMP1516]|eukprot:XP_005787902.1 hypothetical protein EMIHUDRAFT_201590 [Emiliania huxleyi CCMP1516]
MCCRYACLKAAAAKRRARHADGSFSDMRLFELEAICENYLARCRRSALKKQQRESEEEDAEAAIAEHEEDRSPAAQAKKIWARAPYIACHGRLSRHGLESASSQSEVVTECWILRPRAMQHGTVSSQ